MPAINMRPVKGKRNMTPVTTKQKLHAVKRSIGLRF
jgi:hypothetical protein